MVEYFDTLLRDIVCGFDVCECKRLCQNPSFFLAAHQVYVLDRFQV